MLNFEKEVGFIWDIDGVVMDSPHEEAWRTIAQKPEWGVEKFNSRFYLTDVASHPRYEGGDIILTKKGVYDRLGAKTEKEKKEVLEKFCMQKNGLIKNLIQKGQFVTFYSSVDLILEAKIKGVKQAAASASKNAVSMLRKINLKDIPKFSASRYRSLLGTGNLYSLFDIDACGLDLGGKKESIKFASQKLRQMSQDRIKSYIVFEDAPAGIRAAKDCGMFSVGIVRIGTKEDLWKAGADLVVNDLRELPYKELKKNF